MEKFQELGEEAKKKVIIADHIMTQTYPLVRDPKLLPLVLEHLFLSMSNAMGALLHYERLFKRIPPFYDDFESKFAIFSSRMVGRYDIGNKYAQLIKTLKETITQHKKSPMVFSREDKFVICNGNYKMKTITPREIKDYISVSKEFISLINSITKKNEELFNDREL